MKIYETMDKLDVAINVLVSDKDKPIFRTIYFELMNQIILPKATSKTKLTVKQKIQNIIVDSNIPNEYKRAFFKYVISNYDKGTQIPGYIFVTYKFIFINNGAPVSSYSEKRDEPSRYFNVLQYDDGNCMFALFNSVKNTLNIDEL